MTTWSETANLRFWHEVVPVTSAPRVKVALGLKAVEMASLLAELTLTELWKLVSGIKYSATTSPSRDFE